MTNFSFTKIDVPAPVEPYQYISVDGVDAAGEAVGNYGNVDGDGDGTFYGFVATGSNGTPSDPPGSSNTDIVGITSGGEIFGDYVDYENRSHGFVETNGVVTTVDVFLANSTTVSGVTNAGVIYGSYADSANGIHGFFENDGFMTPVDVPGAVSTTVSGVSAAGTIVGTYTDAASVAHGFLDYGGAVQSIDPSGSISTSVVGISDSNEIVGNYQDSANNTWGFVDSNGSITRINIAGATSVGVSAVNSSGEIVGYYVDGSSNVHGFIDNGGVIQSVDVPGATETDILGVSDQGVISGFYNDSSGHQHGFVGTVPTTLIGSSGTVNLVQVGDNYLLENKTTGAGPEVVFGGAPLTAGEFGWTAVGAEQTSSGYEIALKDAAGQYTVWAADANGNVLYDTIGNVAGNSPVLEAIELSFGQDLNGDGVIGIPGTIESAGVTSLVESGNHYFLDSNSTGTGPEVMFGGAPLTPGEYGWTPIGAEQTSSGYEIALKDTAGQYTVWYTDSSGNVTYDPLGGPVSGTSAAFEAFEPGFHQDLNGDGVVGILIGSSASTNLVQVGDNYFLDSRSSGSGPEVVFGGAPLTAGEFDWTPIGAEQTSTGYEIALKDATNGQYTVWATDANGNVLYDTIGNVSASSPLLEATELSFHQDLNGDGVIGIPGSIESAGVTSLVQSGNHYLLDSNSTGTGPELMFGGTPLTPGEYGWTPIGAEQTSTGYEIALKDTAGQYTEWYTDSSGNVTYDPLGGPVSGTSAAFELLESSFHQDLNGDGVIGQAVPAGGTLEVPGFDYGPVTFMGSTGTLTLDVSTAFEGQVFNFSGDGNPATSDKIDLKDVEFGSGTFAYFTGTSSGGTLTVSDAHFDTAQIALEGNYTNSTFQLSSDGSGGTVVIDPPASHAGGTTNTGNQPVTVTVAGPGNDAFVFHPGIGADTIVNAGTTGTFELDGFSSVTSSSELATLLHEAQAGEPQSLFQSVNGGHDTLINLGNHDVITLTNVELADLHASNFIIH